MFINTQNKDHGIDHVSEVGDDDDNDDDKICVLYSVNSIQTMGGT